MDKDDNSHQSKAMNINWSSLKGDWKKKIDALTHEPNENSVGKSNKVL